MPDILVKGLPEAVHRRLKAQAIKHRRSLTQEVLTILERNLRPEAPEFPEPVRGRRPITQRIITRGIREGRA